jgi:hypothetical protein
MYVNGKMRLVETILGIEGGKERKMMKGDKFKYDTFAIL